MTSTSTPKAEAAARDREDRLVEELTVGDRAAWTRIAAEERSAQFKAEDSALDLFHSGTWVQCDRTDCFKWRAGTKRHGVWGVHLTPLGLFLHTSIQRIWEV